MNRAQVNELGSEVRLAFSYRGKVGRLRLHADELLAAGVLDRARYEELLAAYAPHAERSEAVAAALQRRIERETAAAGRRKARAERRLAAVRQRAAQAPGGDGARLNAAHRRALAHLEEIQGVYNALRTLAHAQSAEAVGGFEDRPLDAYAAAFAQRPLEARPTRVWQGATTAGIALAALLLPWTWGAAPAALCFTFLAELSRLAEIPPPAWARAFATLAVLLPIAAAASLHAAFRSAWANAAAFACALLMIASAALPAGWLITRTQTLQSAPQALSSTGPGAWLYGLAGGAFVVLASWALDRRRGETRMRPLDALGVAAMALGAFLGMGTLLAYGADAEPVHVAMKIDEQANHISVALDNRGRFAAEAVLVPVEASDRTAAVRAMVMVKRTAEGAWETVLPPLEAWRRPGRVLAAPRIELLPQSQTPLWLDLTALEEAFGPLTQVRLSWRGEKVLAPAITADLAQAQER